MDFLCVAGIACRYHPFIYLFVCKLSWLWLLKAAFVIGGLDYATYLGFVVPLNYFMPLISSHLLNENQPSSMFIQIYCIFIILY